MSSRPDLQNIEDVTDGADEAPTAEAVPVEMDGFGIFDDDDLSDDTAEPWVVFRTEDEARGYLMMIGDGGCATPVIRLVTLSGYAIEKPAPAKAP